MKPKLTVFLFLVVICECYGQLSILGNLFSNAHEKVEGVAGAVLGGLFGKNRPNPSQGVPPKGTEETIIVVVEENDHRGYENNQYDRPHPHHHHPPPHRHPRPPFDYDSRPPPPPHHHHPRPPFDNDSPPPPPPHHHPRRPPFNSHLPPPPPPPDRPNHKPNGDHRPGYNNHNQEPHYYDEYMKNQGNDNNFHGNDRNDQQFDPSIGNSKDNTYQSNHKDPAENQGNKPTTEYYKTPDATKSTYLPKSEDVTKKPSDDKPLFIPLNPNEYIYGGDRINITAPKRDADKIKTEESDNDDFDIDIRLKNE